MKEYYFLNAFQVFTCSALSKALISLRFKILQEEKKVDRIEMIFKTCFKCKIVI